MKLKAHARLLGGQTDTVPEDGNPGLLEDRNVRYDRGPAQRRKGIQRVARADNHHTVLTLDGTDDYIDVPLDTRIHTFKRLWTVEALVNPTNFTTNAKNILGAAHATDYSLRLYCTTAGKVEAKVQDSAGTVVTLTSATTFSAGTTLAIQVVRDGTSLYLRVNGVLEDSDTMADLDGKAPGGNLTIGRNNGTDHFVGVIDFVRCILTARADQAYGRMRHPDPLAEDVAFDYCLEDPANSRCDDRSQFGNNGTVNGSPATGTPLTLQTHPITALATWLDSDNRKRLFMAAGNRVYFQVLSR